jgi:hypothetical protein
MATIRDFQDTDLRDVFGQASRLRKILCRASLNNYGFGTRLSNHNRDAL